MPNFLIVVDPDETRRTRFMRTTVGRLDPIGGLTTQEISTGPFAAAWAASPRAPVSRHLGHPAGEAEATVLWGRAFRSSDRSPISAEALSRAWNLARRQVPETFDGFFAGTTFRCGTTLVVGGDILGLFPIYYVACGEVRLVGSSPELFVEHPSFSPDLDAAALVGILTTGFPVGARMMLRGVRRLSSAHALVWDAHGAREVRQFSIDPYPELEEEPHGRQLEAYEDVHATAIEKQVPQDGATALLLSGGRDSRLIAGYLGEGGTTVEALVLGDSDDHDVRCALPIARALGFPCRVAPLSDEAIADGGVRQARWEHLCNGFSSVHTWGAIDPLTELPPVVYAGYVREAREVPVFPREDEDPFAWTAGMGPGTGVLRDLLRPEVSPLVEEVAAEARAVYDAGSDHPQLLRWLYLLSHYARFHPGGAPWRLSFGSWPALPILDRELLTVLASVSPDLLDDRRAVDTVLRRRFPLLAALPLDRNSHNIDPLSPGVGLRTLRAVQRRWPGLDGRKRRLERYERRSYHRLYDFDRPGWRVLRRTAEPYRAQLNRWIDPDRLAACLPPPDIDLSSNDPISGGVAPKLLVGLMLWLGERSL